MSPAAEHHEKKGGQGRDHSGLGDSSTTFCGFFSKDLFS